MEKEVHWVVATQTFCISPLPGGNDPICLIFFKWVGSTTNQFKSQESILSGGIFQGSPQGTWDLPDFRLPIQNPRRYGKWEMGMGPAYHKGGAMSLEVPGKSPLNFFHQKRARIRDVNMANLEVSPGGNKALLKPLVFLNKALLNPLFLSQYFHPRRSAMAAEPLHSKQ